MVHACYVSEVNGVMTIFTGVAGLNVRRIFAGRGSPVMATATIATDVAVVKAIGVPVIGGMTVVASIVASNMGRMLTRCGRTVVATEARPYNLGVVNPRYG